MTFLYKFRKLLDIYHCNSTPFNYIKLYSTSLFPVFSTDSSFNIILNKNFMRNSHTLNLDNHMRSYKNYEKLKLFLPAECLKSLKRKLEVLYLIDSNIAEEVVECLIPYLKKNSGNLVVECFPGMGFITEELLRNNIPMLQLFEPTIEFHKCLEELAEKYPGKLKLSNKNLSKIYQLDYLDRINNGNRIEELMKDVPRKRWRDDPCMSIVGTCVDTSFFRYLIKALVLQTTFVTHGRIEMFLLMKPKDYLVLTNDKAFNFNHQRYTNILFNLFFDFELMKAFPREAFLPWESKKTTSKEIHPDKIFLVHLVVKEKFPLPLEDLVPFYFFMRRLFRERTKIIPTLEAWVPGCGENIIWPKLEHKHYPEDINIFTSFGDLSPHQILEVFLEMYNHPSYPGSSFMEMVETQLIKSETVESSSNFMISDLERNIVDDIRRNEN